MLRAFCILFSLIVASGQLAPSNFTKIVPPTILINLDLPASQRWLAASIPKSYCEELRRFEPVYQKQIREAHHSMKKGDYKRLEQAALIYLNFFLEREIKEELISFSNMCGVSQSFIVIYNFAYELGVLACTSLIVRDKNSNVFIASNLDYNNYDQFGALTFQAVFLRGGEPIVKSNYLFGFFGYTRAINSKDLMLSLNQRSFKKKLLTVEYLIDSFNNGTAINTIGRMRQVIEETQSFDELVKKASEVKISAPIYVIAADPQQGIIIERSRNDVFAYKNLEDDKFLVKTNSDFDYESNDIRYKGAFDKLTKLTQNGTTGEEVLEQVLSESPNFFITNTWSGDMIRTISSSIVEKDFKMQLYRWVLIVN